jgi:hypothetical protein
MNQASEPTSKDQAAPRASTSEEHRPALGEAPPASSGRGVRSLLFAPLKSLWRLSRPIRQPVVSRFDQHMATVLRADLNVISDQLNRFAVQTAQAQQQSLTAMREMNIFVEGLVREIAQLQEQVQMLSQTCAQLGPASESFAPWAEGEGGRPATIVHGRYDCQEIST